MSPYEYFIGAISIVVGLAVASLLTRAFALLAARTRVVFHFAPAIWALCILAWLVHYWYIGWLVNDFRGWSFAIFLLMMSMMITLYGAAELILPSADGQRPNMIEHFESSGRLGLAFLAATFVLAFPFNHFVLEEADPGGSLLDSAFLPVVGFALNAWGGLARSARGRGAAALAFLAFTIWVYAGLISDEQTFGAIVSDGSER